MPVPVTEARPPTASPAKQRVAQATHDVSTPNAPKSAGKTRKPTVRARVEVGEECLAGTSKAANGEPWSWKSLTESSANKAPPVFTRDGRCVIYFFSVVGASVKIYSAGTGQVVSTLEDHVPDFGRSSGSSHAVTSVILSPHNPFQLITGSLDGHIRIWDFLDAELLQTIDVTLPVSLVAAHENFKDHVFVAVARPTKQKTKKAKIDKAENNFEVLRVSLKPTDATAGSPVQVPSDVRVVGKTRATTGLGLSPSGAWLVATGGHKAYVCSTSDLKAGFTKFVSPSPLTCLAFHPSEEYFATGDGVGCIRLWYCLNAGLPQNNGAERKAQTTTLHWHSHAVSSIAFTGNGAYLLSGGEEAVLVIWQLHSGKKEFVPRVGAPISHVALSKASDGQEEYLLALADATFVFIPSGTLKISKSIARVKLDPAISHDRPSTSSSIPLAVHSTTSTLILPSSHPSSLQVFQPSSSKLIAELEVSPSNRVSRKDEKPLEPSRVERVIVADSGDWMITIDHREQDDVAHAETYMKIWWWDHKAEFWILNTRIDRPHGHQNVTDAAFRPGKRPADQLMVVTTGEDGNIKTWRLRSVRNKLGQSEAEFWVARSTQRFRSGIPRHIAWSADGSLFAISVGIHVVLYEALSNALYQVLTSPDCSQVSSAHFVGPSGRYITVAGSVDLMLWDLLTKSMQWHYRSSSVLDQVIVNPKEEIFALLERAPTLSTDLSSTKVLLFNPSSPTPSATRTLPFRLRCAIGHPSLGTLSSETSSFTLVGVTDAWNVVVFGDDVRLPHEEGSTAQGLDGVENSRKQTLFQDIFGKSAFAELDQPSASSAISLAQPWRGKEIGEIFDAPAYLMPPLGSLFDSLVDGFLTARSAAEAPDDDEQEDEQEDDIEMADASDVPIATTQTSTMDRAVDQREMDIFVDLFKKHAVSGSTSKQSPVQANGLPNGVPKVNGVRTPRINGVSHTPVKENGPVKGAKAQPPLTSVSRESSHAEESTPAVVVGKKRKKSLG
ncbi:WD40 repeat-like protein [Wolfiporia cocos MD-104 SS10]|uniref:WD40 repeat-like protein n=1 Tax=Wolfiporia cocos (strain MD-104) TaxID=742152 RepID=A0A2H3JB94_WOLCO|nr:WD40 repeat-like protein [Wolfiporia cocos MD-104 SS10]